MFKFLGEVGYMEKVTAQDSSVLDYQKVHICSQYRLRRASRSC